ncbi:MAG TPA: hypothetical protein VKB93_12640 [Thermoanaerobaculia bacterium]|nr:hypothetical protein [Thermoanaerobaculia bacterium]
MRKQFAVLAVLVCALSVQGQGVRWAGSLQGPSPKVLHAPDERDAGSAVEITLGDFEPTFTYTGLRQLLRVSERDWARADVIAFELNGTSTAGPEFGWESSKWRFTDGVNLVEVNFNAAIGKASDPAIIANSSIIGPDGTVFSGAVAYRKVFGICSPRSDSQIVSFLLFDLDVKQPRVNTRSPNFKILLRNGGKNAPDEDGSVDPDAIGVIVPCP